MNLRKMTKNVFDFKISSWIKVLDEKEKKEKIKMIKKKNWNWKVKLERKMIKSKLEKAKKIQSISH